MKLLIAIDSSAVSKTVIDEVARRPWPSGTTVCVLHIIDWPPLPSNASLIQSVKESAELLVNSASTKLYRAGLQATAKVVEGHPQSAVAEYAKEWGADLVLIGSHGAGGIVRFLLGSVAQAALRRSHCSVEIVRRPALDSATAATGMKILLAMDGSDCAMASVRSVAERPCPVGSQIQVISVIPVATSAAEMISPVLTSVHPAPDIVGEIEKQTRGNAEEAVARARHILAETRLKVVETEFLPIGDAREVILDQAKNWDADLIVVGSHGYHGIDRITLGSDSESVAIHAHCSVEVIRESGSLKAKEMP